jgi:glycosyltransferase involved in cell wall biosynthesis
MLNAQACPLVSIIICNFNYGHFVRCAIESALAQTYANTQVIVVDDGSTDSSRTVIDEFVSAGAVKAVYQENGGQCAAYNAGFAASSGDILLFLDSDDMYLPQTAATVVAAFGAQTAKVHFRLSFFCPAGKPLAGHTPRTLPSGDTGHLLVTKGLLYTSAPGSGNAYARRALADLFPLPVTDDKICADFYTVYGSALIGPVAAVDAVLGRYRLHRSPDEETASLVFGNSMKRSDESQRLQARIAVFRAHIRRRLGLELPKRLLSFSTQKQDFVVEALRETRYARRLASGHTHAAPLWYSLRHSPDFSLLLKSGLVVWAVLVVLLPRALALPVARYVSNAASR